ncbi:universal stress protein [Pseudaestuariivita rosea]|uniref:universal stress protein n=1 Tax=Pseudaestuariivita rosea TaxID=2763263 RepID=UPI001ABA1C12|nr:universal stress protein [Pseudaestuariivita rosea]
MISHVLVATDLSARSDRAVRRACQIAKSRMAKLTVLSVLDNAMPDDMVQVLTGKAQKTLQDVIDHSLAADGVDYTIDIHPGDPTVDILRKVDDEAVDLLVMGTHRPRPFMDLLRETTMQRIVRQTACPVLLVKDGGEDDYDTILAAVDFSPSSTAALRLAHDMSPGGLLKGLHVVHVPYQGRLATGDQSSEALAGAFIKEAKQNAATWLGQTDLPIDEQDIEIVDGSVYPVLCDRVLKSQADLVAVGAHGRVGSMPAVLGSLANDLMRDPPCDVLIARPIIVQDA